MSSADAFELAWQMILSPLKLLFIILVSFLALLIMYAVSFQHEFINFTPLETYEIEHLLFACLVQDSYIQENKFTESILTSCAPFDHYGAELTLDNKRLILNEHVFTTHKGFCDRLSSCHIIHYKDLNNRLLTLFVVLRRTS